MNNLLDTNNNQTIPTSCESLPIELFDDGYNMVPILFPRMHPLSINIPKIKSESRTSIVNEPEDYCFYDLNTISQDINYHVDNIPDFSFEDQTCKNSPSLENIISEDLKDEKVPEEQQSDF
jgi:hypothetical protein